VALLPTDCDKLVERILDSLRPADKCRHVELGLKLLDDTVVVVPAENQDVVHRLASKQQPGHNSS
jgi:hypothetical protein